MKPHEFTYQRVHRLDDALELLADDTEESKILAGGLSLVPMMNLRLAAPPRLVDVNRVAGLADVRVDDAGALHVGALVRHQTIVDRRGPLTENGYAVLPMAGRWIGHAPIRARGTVGGSLAHCDPTAEWCVCAVLLDAQMLVLSRRGERIVPAERWFRGFFDAGLEPDEMLVGVTFPRPRGYVGFMEYAQRSGDFAIVVVGVAIDLDQGAVIRDPRVVVGGVSGTPVVLTDVQAALHGSTATADLVAHAGALAGRAIEGRAGSYGDATYQRRLVASLTARAIGQAVGIDADEGRLLGHRAVLQLDPRAA
jgi:carbon-monoxide dehydrogenase medium subunit